MGRERGTRERERLPGRLRRDVAAGPRLSAAAFWRRAPPSPSLSPALACAQAGADKMKTCFVLFFWHLPSSATNAGRPPLLSGPFPNPPRLPFYNGHDPGARAAEKKKGQKYPLAPKPPPVRPPLAATAPNLPPWRVGCCLYIYIFWSFFFSSPPIGSLSRWVCAFLFKDPPPPVVLKPGRREPRAHFCLDAGVAGEGAGDGGREEAGGRRAGGRRSPGRQKKNNPPPQAFCLTCVDAKEGLGFFFFPPLVLFPPPPRD